MTNSKSPSLLQAFVPILLLVGLLGLNVAFFGGDSSYGPNQIALLLAGGAAVVISNRLGIGWKSTMEAIKTSISSALEALIILLLIGALAGTWLVSGVVPTMIVYGLDIMNPTIFLFASCIICAIVSVSTGSSWSTVATVGVALLGIGHALGISPGWIAGAVISGAYFGDKMSPLSDTTNLAPAVAGTNLFTHIKYMTYTTVPSIVIALVVFLVAGFMFDCQSDPAQIADMQATIQGKFDTTSPLLFLVPVAVIFLIIKKVPAIPSLLIGCILGALVCIVFQPSVAHDIAAASWIKQHETSQHTPSVADYDAAHGFAYSSYRAATISMMTETTDFFEAENNAINDLFNIPVDDRSSLLKGGGMAGMMNTIWLIICAMIFGGAMQAAGLLKRITQAILSRVDSAGSLIAATSGTAVFFNLTASDQYLAIVVPGKMFKEEYEEQGLAPENLSRTLEDSGTVTSVLVPWNTCGATQQGVLGVSVLEFLPYCIFNLVSPLMTILYGYMGWKIRKLASPSKEEA